MNTYRKKLIEVDLPLDDINRESVREKYIRHRHPFSLHTYWARRPLAACRAVIFASIVDDPSACVDEFPTDEAQAKERERLHKIIKRLVVYENCNDENLLAEARYEIARSAARSRGEIAPVEPDAILKYLRDNAISVYDPFCGGGSIPFEAQRLGLPARGSDLNPLPVLLTKAMIELPPQFHHQAPVNPDVNLMSEAMDDSDSWQGTAGLASDIRYYGTWMREQAYKRIGHLYPKAKLPDGSEATVIAWLWARTVPCANPACGINMPLMSTFQLSKKKNNAYWAKPVVNPETNTVSFEVQKHAGDVPNKGTVNRHGAVCIACGSAVKLSYVREYGRTGKISETMTAIVAEKNTIDKREGKTKLFLSPTDEHIKTALEAAPNWRPTNKLPDQARSISVQLYGFTEWGTLFTERQLFALTIFGDLLKGVRAQIIGAEAKPEYADAVCTYLALALGRIADRNCSFTIWDNRGGNTQKVFGRQGIGMIWDFAEANPFSASTQNWMSQVEWVAEAVEHFPARVNQGEVYQANAATTIYAYDRPVIITDPPYYDNIHYADSSDFFYVWLRRWLRDIYPELFAGMLTPKREEMVANRYRFEDPRQHFEDLLSETLKRMREHCTDQFPSSIFYAYRQQEVEQDGKTSTGWETMLSAIVLSGFQIVGTWPMHTEQTNALKAHINALASSIVLVCRPRDADARVVSRREFLDALKKEMPPALDQFTREGHIAPVDLAQAAIGPGMEVYSRYNRVERVSGELVPVREALADINREIDAYFEQEEGDFDAETRVCFAWLKQHGYAEGRFGEAEVLATARAVSIDSMQRLLVSGGGIVQLRSPDGYYEEVERTEAHALREDFPLSGITTAWEGCLQMVFHLNLEGGRTIEGAAEIAEAMHKNPECSPLSSVERLARSLYNHYDRQSDSTNAVYFNNLVTSWDKIMSEMEDMRQPEML